MSQPTLCKHCSDPMRGRSDKKFCSDECRNAYNNQRATDHGQIFRPLISRLKANYKALCRLKQHKSIASLDELALLGFNPSFLTHTANDPEGTTLYCFNIGYRITPDHQLMIVSETENPNLKKQVL